MFIYCSTKQILISVHANGSAQIQFTLSDAQLTDAVVVENHSDLSNAAATHEALKHWAKLVQPDRAKADRLRDAAWAQHYWFRKHKHLPDTNPHKIQSDQFDRVVAILQYRLWREIAKTAPRRKDQFGNTIYDGQDAIERLIALNPEADADARRDARKNGERYAFDFGICRSRYGWEQFDTNQDAWYFGVWYHSNKRLTLTYAEGDITLVECPTIESFKATMEDAARFYGSPPPAAIGYSTGDDGKWIRTEFFSDTARPKFDQPQPA